MSVAYQVLKAAQNLFGKSPPELAEAERARAQDVAQRQFALETSVLATPEARDVHVPLTTLDDAMASIRARYEDDDSFADDLARNDLAPETLRQALERELKVEAVLEKVGQHAAAVAEIDVELYYHYHPDQFRRLETRLASHILITLNDDFPENTREAARARMDAIAARLAKDPKRFAEQAMKHSECPTAMQGGQLGEVRPGQLYPELEHALFGLEQGALSAVTESPLGFHLLRCERITPAAILSLPEARAPIRKLLEGRRKRVCQQAWLKTLKLHAEAT